MAECVSVPELSIVPEPAPESPRGDLAIMLTGGGARAAYQVGLLRGLARHFPELEFPIITGVSAGAINAICLAAMGGNLARRVDDVHELWCDLECHHVFSTNYSSLLPFRGALRALLPRRLGKWPHGFFNAGPLATLLRRILNTPYRGMPIAGIRRNLAENGLKAVALITMDYSTGQSVRWVQGRFIDTFEGPNRRVEQTELTVEHVLASAALPFVFPAVQIGKGWYGDGGIRLSSPLSAAVHLGARRIIAMSTGYQRTPDEAARPAVHGYPPAAQIIGQLVNAVFLDAIDEDVLRAHRFNELIGKIDVQHRNGFKPIDLLVLRPSQDLGKLAAKFERNLPPSVKLFTRALGARETESPDVLSMLMFEPNYTRALIEIGEADLESRLHELREFLGIGGGQALRPVPPAS
ncbi:MAG TPA: patatin-like phospholipase family protein [Thermoanaerobaculia bacterium]|nr:patatin-like phospholipase family protein [Thermoanaerobaculia bacterium]